MNIVSSQDRGKVAVIGSKTGLNLRANTPPTTLNARSFLFEFDLSIEKEYRYFLTKSEFSWLVRGCCWPLTADVKIRHVSPTLRACPTAREIISQHVVKTI